MTTPRSRLAERQVLLIILAGFVLAYTGALLAVVLQRKTDRADTIKRSIVRWMPAPTPVRAIDPHYVMADLMDPSLLSLPSTHGFSHQLWQRSPPVAHQTLAPGIVLAYLDPERSNALPSLLNLAPLAEAVRTVVNKAAAAAEDRDEPNPIEPSVITTQSTLRVYGDLAGRTVVQRPTLPTINSATPLRPTQVRAGVGVDGTVRYAMLQRSCGNESVDGQALALTREICFELRDRPQANPLSWGLLRFSWATAAPAVATNGAPVAPP